MKYKILENEATADIAFEAYGKTIEDAFESAAFVLMETMTDTKKVLEKAKKRINIQSEDLKSLLYDFIEKIIVLHESENLLFSFFDVHHIKKIQYGYSLTATLKGEKFNPKKHIRKSVVKAVTYFGMEIEEINSKQGKEWKVKLTLDL